MAVKSRAGTPILSVVRSEPDRVDDPGPLGARVSLAGRLRAQYGAGASALFRARPDPRFLPPHLAASRGRSTAPAADVLRPRRRHRHPSDPGRDLGEP
jgi:hypothetical protein